jgi:enoyl-CoA hydratase/carnithine racemase
MSEARIRIDMAGRVARLVISNPQKRNAMTYGMWRVLRQAVMRLEKDPSVSVLVLAGDGDQAFVSGADISEFK